VDRLTVENRQLVEAAATWQTQDASEAPESAEPSSEPPSPLSRLLALWRWLVLVLVVAVTTMVTLLGWPR